MDFEELKKVPLGDALHAMVNEGGAVTGGLFVGGFVGRQVENMIMPTPVTPTSSTIDKVKGWTANNVPKLLVWYALRGKIGAMEDVKKGVVTSAAFDTVMRLLNSGVNPATATVMGYQVLGENMGTGADAGTVQRLVQEINMLRAEIGKRSVQVQQTPMDPRLPPYVGEASGVIPPAERDRKYGFMQPVIPGVPRPPGVSERERRYGFASGSPDMSAMTVGKPGAAYIQAGKMFGMQ